jgi:hypothetical protein
MDDVFLPPHVHCCRRGDAFVFLDLKQDEYTLIMGEAAATLADLTDNADSTASALRRLEPLQELIQAGLLTTDPTAGRIFTATRTTLAIQPLLDSDTTSRPKVKLSHVYNFIAACTTAAVRLRWSRIQNTVSAVAMRKAQDASQQRVDLDKARQLAAIFHGLRALFPFNYLCLFDSLALVEFMARHDVFPDWVFGVKLEPWGAHCWIQHQEFTFNESVEEAADYTPIMVI